MSTVLLGNTSPTIFEKADESKAAGPDNGKKVRVLRGQNAVTRFSTPEAPMAAVASITALWSGVHSNDPPEWVESDDDNLKALKFLKNELLPKLNLFGYGQVESPYGSGEFFDHIDALTATHENLITSRVPDREAILGSIKEFLSTGR